MVTVRCEAIDVQGRCSADATVLRYMGGGYFALCDGCRLLSKPRLHLRFETPVSLYREAHPRARQDGA